jgi:hypothetical protein
MFYLWTPEVEPKIHEESARESALDTPAGLHESSEATCGLHESNEATSQSGSSLASTQPSSGGDDFDVRSIDSGGSFQYIMDL